MQPPDMICYANDSFKYKERLFQVQSLYPQIKFYVVTNSIDVSQPLHDRTYVEKGDSKEAHPQEVCVRLRKLYENIAKRKKYH